MKCLKIGDRVRKIYTNYAGVVTDYDPGCKVMVQWDDGSKQEIKELYLTLENK